MTYLCPSCNTPLDYTQYRKQKCNSCLHEWETYHVIPLNDAKEHILTYGCICKPDVKIESGNVIVVHSSFDGREGVEWVNKILNQ